MLSRNAGRSIAIDSAGPTPMNPTTNPTIEPTMAPGPSSAPVASQPPSRPTPTPTPADSSATRQPTCAWPASVSELCVDRGALGGPRCHRLVDAHRLGRALTTTSWRHHHKVVVVDAIPPRSAFYLRVAAAWGWSHSMMERKSANAFAEFVLLAKATSRPCKIACRLNSPAAVEVLWWRVMICQTVRRLSGRPATVTSSRRCRLSPLEKPPDRGRGHRMRGRRSASRRSGWTPRIRPAHDDRRLGSIGAAGPS